MQSIEIPSYLANRIERLRLHWESKGRMVRRDDDWFWTTDETLFIALRNALRAEGLEEDVAGDYGPPAPPVYRD